MEEGFRGVLPVAFLEGTGCSGTDNEFLGGPVEGPGGGVLMPDPDEKPDVGKVGGADAGDKQELVGVRERTMTFPKGEQVVNLVVGEEVQHFEAVETGRVDVQGMGGEVGERTGNFLVSFLGRGDVVCLEQAFYIRQGLGRENTREK